MSICNLWIRAFNFHIINLIILVSKFYLITLRHIDVTSLIREGGHPFERANLQFSSLKIIDNISKLIDRYVVENSLKEYEFYFRLNSCYWCLRKKNKTIIDTHRFLYRRYRHPIGPTLKCWVRLCASRTLPDLYPPFVPQKQSPVLYNVNGTSQSKLELKV